MRGYTTGGTGVPGTPGTNGKTVRNGTGTPDNGAGADGDFYIDTDVYDIYGPKAAGVWGSGTSLVPAPTVIGTPADQSLTTLSLQVVAITTDASPVTVNTAYAPSSNAIAHIEGDISATDRTAHTGRLKDIFAGVKNSGGTITILGSASITNSLGDAALADATVDLTISSNTLRVTFTPPLLYSGSIEWVCNLKILEN